MGRQLFAFLPSNLCLYTQVSNSRAATSLSQGGPWTTGRRSEFSVLYGVAWGLILPRLQDTVVSESEAVVGCADAGFP